MNLAEYLLNAPKTLEERRIENCAHYRREKQKQYRRKAKRKMVQQLLEDKAR